MSRQIAGRGPGANAFARLGRATLDLLYPPVCVACGAESGESGGLCAPCFRAAPFIAGPVCDRCGAPLPPGAGEACDGCAHAPPGWEQARAAALYEGPARRAALALKHGDRLEIAPVAAVWMARAGAELLARADLIAPVPLHWTRLVRRRFNQSAELSRALARRVGRAEASAPDLLRRVRRTPSQEGRSRAARIENVAGAFRLSPRWRGRVAGRRVLLVDDVMTTGATLTACAETLRAEGAAGVDALVLCRVARGGDGA